MRNQIPTKRHADDKFADLSIDTVFKIVFYDTKDSSNLKLLLNSFLPPNAQIDKIKTYKDRVIDSEYLDGKVSVLDIHCEKENGEEFIVEMQNKAVINNYMRFIYYCAKTFCKKARKGDKFYKKLRPVYMLVILNEDFIEENLMGETELVSHLSIMNENTYKVMPLSMKWIFVRLFLMKKSSFVECNSKEERCMWILKNLKNLKEYPEWLESSEYKSFAISAEIANFDADKKEQYDKVMTYKEYREAVEETKYILGKRAGVAEGEAKGAAERSNAIAKAMLLNGIDVAVIASCTGLSAEDIAAL